MRTLLLCVLLAVGFGSFAQNPKIVIGIVVDQMSAQYLNEFESDFSEDGFKKLMKNGAVFRNCNFGYSGTMTGPGHASIFSGTYPSSHGIAANNWYDRGEKEGIYCVEDDGVETVGASGNAGQRSPKRMYGSTITDMLRLSQTGKSKVIGVALKDRSAILPGGHLANGAYWWDASSGQWITSSHYSDDLPEWAKTFNKENGAEQYIDTWSFSLDKKLLSDYKAHNAFEEPYLKGGATEFPYDLKSIAKDDKLWVLKSSPFGDTYTADFALAALDGEDLGKDDDVDFLSVSFSSPDYIGHQFGPYSAEVRDEYHRLDHVIANFLSELEERFAEGEYLVFLTADHGVMPNAEYLKSLGMNVELVDVEAMKKSINDKLFTAYEVPDLLMAMFNQQVYLDQEKMKIHQIKPDEAARKVTSLLMSMPEIQCAMSSHDLEHKDYSDPLKKRMQNSYHKDRSGDVMFTFKPFFDDSEHGLGAGHGKPFVFDTHVPLIFYAPGWVKLGSHYQNVDVNQISATLADMLKIQRPPSCTAESLYDYLK